MAFRRNKAGVTIYNAIAGLVPAKGIAQTALVERFAAKQHSEWANSSVGPALTYLHRVAILEITGKRGSRRIKLLRPYIEGVDDTAISKVMGDRAGKQHRAGNGAASRSTKIMIAVGGNETVVLKMADAKRLWRELSVVFG